MKIKYFATYLLFLALFMIQTFGFAQSGSKATSGAGLYKDKIFWVNWDLNSNSLSEDNITEGTIRTFISPSGILYKVTISNIVKTAYNSYGTNFTSANVDSWSGNNMPSGYGGFSNNSTKVIGLSNKKESNQSGDASKVSFRITVTATLPNGTVINAAALAIAGSESLSGNSEYYQLSVPVGSPPLRYLDKYIKDNKWADMKVRLTVSNGRRIIKATNPTFEDSKGDALLLAENVPYIDVELKGGGGQHVAIGIFEELDYSDAPVSYGSAYHVVNSVFVGGDLADGVHDLSTTSNLLDQDRAKLSVDPLLLIGTTVDTEANVYNASPGGGSYWR